MSTGERCRISGTSHHWIPTGKERVGEKEKEKEVKCVCGVTEWRAVKKKEKST